MDNLTTIEEHEIDLSELEDINNFTDILKNKELFSDVGLDKKRIAQVELWKQLDAWRKSQPQDKIEIPVIGMKKRES